LIKKVKEWKTLGDSPGDVPELTKIVPTALLSYSSAPEVFMERDRESKLF